MFPGFTTGLVTANGITVHVCYGGTGPPVLLLHGYPQTHVMWHKVAPVLARRFTVVCPDLRGYGDSGKPPGGQDHDGYAKRTMAQDQVAVMAALGFGRFAVAGHDRGARVALRMALDHPQAVSRLAVLDIVPTKTIYETIDQQHAATVWRYFFLTQPVGLPEHLIGADPQYYLHYTLGEWCATAGVPAPEAVAEYTRCFTPAVIHASCEDYRAGAGIDLIHDQADAGQRLSCPVLALWSKAGIGRAYDVERIWAQRAPDLRGRALDCGHFLAEERPGETATELLAFLTRDHP
jgi:haloacetate dehalogenase